MFDMHPKADERFVIKGEKYRITVLSEQMLRLEYSESGVFEDRADGVAVGDGAVAVEGGGDGDHNLGQGCADGHHRCTDDDFGHVETLGNTHGTVHKPVATLNQQQRAHRKQQQRAP